MPFQHFSLFYSFHIFLVRHSGFTYFTVWIFINNLLRGLYTVTKTDDFQDVIALLRFWGWRNPSLILEYFARALYCFLLIPHAERKTDSSLENGWVYRYSTANEGPVRIQYKRLVPIYVFPEMKLLFPKQNFNVLSPSSYSYICLWEIIYFQDRSAYSAAGKYVGRSWEYIKRSKTHECENWDWGRTERNT